MRVAFDESRNDGRSRVIVEAPFGVCRRELGFETDPFDLARARHERGILDDREIIGGYATRAFFGCALEGH